MEASPSAKTKVCLSQLGAVREGSQRGCQLIQEVTDNQKFFWLIRTTERKEASEIRLLLPFRTAGVLEPRTDLEQSEYYFYKLEKYQQQEPWPEPPPQRANKATPISWLSAGELTNQHLKNKMFFYLWFLFPQSPWSSFSRTGKSTSWVLLASFILILQARIPLRMTVQEDVSKAEYWPFLPVRMWGPREVTPGQHLKGP